MRQPRKSGTYLVMSAIAVMLIVACGASDDYGSYGSWGSEITNMQVSANLTPETMDVDICNPSSVDVIANITAEQILESIPASTLRLRGYIVRFSTNETGVPVPADTTYSANGTLPLTDARLFFLDSGTKAAIVDGLNSGAYPLSPPNPVYTAKYTIYGTDLISGIDKLWGITEEFSFRMGRHSLCTLVVTPAVASVTGLLNPDIDPSDDITISISGGRAPYAFSSNSLSIIAPAAMTTDGSVTLDPTASLSPPETVTVTVMDADAQVATISITIN